MNDSKWYRYVGVTQRLDKIIYLLQSLQLKENKQMATLEELKTQVTANTDVEQSALLLLNQLHQMLVDAKSDPVVLDAVISQLDVSKEALAAAVKANT